MKQSTLNTLENMGRIIARDIDRDFRHVSFILRKQNIIAIGSNKRKTHPQAAQIGYRYSEPHSELSALLKVPKDCRTDLVLVNFRFNRKGYIRNSAPCKICKDWAVDVFKEIYHSVDDGVVKLK